MLNRQQVMKLLHHRPPYLLVEEVSEISADQITTHYFLNGDEYFFKGHFPGAPVMPGAMMQEMATQSAGILLTQHYSPVENYDSETTKGYALGVLSRVKGTKYRGFAKPGDQLTMKVELKERNGNAFDFVGKLFRAEENLMRIEFRLVNIEDSPLYS